MAMRRWLSSEEVNELREATVGVVCNGKCDGSGAYILYEGEVGNIHDCLCMSVFKERVRITSAGIPRRYWEFTFDQLSKAFIEKNATATEVIQRYIQNINVMVSDGVGIYFCGGKGVAKTAISCLIMKAALSHGWSSYMIPFSQLTSMIRSSIEDESLRMKLAWLRDEVDLLVVDEIDKDFNAADTSSYTGTYVNDFFRNIYDRKASLIVTANLDKRKLLGKQASNVVDRFNELIEVPLVGESYRTSTKAEEILLNAGKIS